MSFLPFVILAYLLNSLAVTADKFLLKKFIPDPLVYVFYFSLFSLIAIFLLPFTNIPTLVVFLLASTSTLTWTTGAYFMFKALKESQVSRVIPTVGTLTALFLLIHAFLFATITINQAWAAGLLISGLIFLTLFNLRGSFQIRELLLEILASLLFALSYLLLREAYLKMDFLTVLGWSRIILFPLGVTIILAPSLRKKIFNSEGLSVNFKSSSGLLFLAGQSAGGLSQLLLTFSISLASPALVNSLQGIQYIFLLMFSLILSKKFPQIFAEKSSGKIFLSKLTGIILIALGLYILSYVPSEQSYKIGVTYSPQFASQLGLDPKLTYLKMLNELQVKLVRLPVYWNEVESFPNLLNFSNIDYYLTEAQKRDVEVILVLGYKQPRWPECFAPTWVSETTLKDRQEKILNLVQNEVNHFKRFTNISTWQIENEPLFHFGNCDKITNQTKALLQKEIETVKKADSRPILVTDSGELSDWVRVMREAGIFGHTLYRSVWSPYFGSVDYPLPPVFYQLKGELARLLSTSKAKIIISELQAEPWMPDYKNIWDVKVDEQAKLLPVSKLSSNIEFAKQTGVSEMILWGSEWWYYMSAHGHPEYIEYIKTIF